MTSAAFFIVPISVSFPVPIWPLSKIRADHVEVNCQAAEEVVVGIFSADLVIQVSNVVSPKRAFPPGTNVLSPSLAPE